MVLCFVAATVLLVCSAALRSRRNEQLNQQLADAAQSGDAVRVKILLEQGADANAEVCTLPTLQHVPKWVADYVPAFAWQFVLRELLPKTCAVKASPLLIAAESPPFPQDALIVACLLQHGATVSGNSVSPKGAAAFTALDAAISCGDNAAARVLLDHGANPNDSPQNFAFFNAVQQNNLPMLRLMLSHGAKNTPGEYGESALQRAAENDAVPVLQLLLSHGFPLEGRDWKNRTALDYAIKNQSRNAEAFLRRARTDANAKKVPKNRP